MPSWYIQITYYAIGCVFQEATVWFHVQPVGTGRGRTCASLNVPGVCILFKGAVFQLVLVQLCTGSAQRD